MLGPPKSGVLSMTWGWTGTLPTEGARMRSGGGARGKIADPGAPGSAPPGVPSVFDSLEVKVLHPT